MAEVGMISSIFGKTSAELEKERREAYQGLIQPLRGRTGRERDVEGVTNLLSLIARKYGEKKGGDPAMQKALEAERKQAELNEYLSGIPAGDPRGELAIAKAKASVGDMKGYSESMETASLLERYAEAQREAGRVREEKGADELSEALDREDLARASAALYKNPDDAGALETLVAIGGTNAPNLLYAVNQLRDTAKQKGGMTANQVAIAGRYLQAIQEPYADPSKTWKEYKQVFGDEFIATEPTPPEPDETRGGAVTKTAAELAEMKRLLEEEEKRQLESGTKLIGRGTIDRR